MEMTLRNHASCLKTTVLTQLSIAIVSSEVTIGDELGQRTTGDPTLTALSCFSLVVGFKGRIGPQRIQFSLTVCADLDS